VTEGEHDRDWRGIILCGGLVGGLEGDALASLDSEGKLGVSSFILFFSASSSASINRMVASASDVASKVMTDLTSSQYSSSSSNLNARRWEHVYRFADRAPCKARLRADIDKGCLEV
jgi:hypothetical protein